MFLDMHNAKYSTARPASSLATSNTLESIREYARSLLDSVSNDGSPRVGSATTNGNGSVAHNGHAAMTQRRSTVHRPEDVRRIESEREKESEGGLTGCREAVEILTRNPKKGTWYAAQLSFKTDD